MKRHTVVIEGGEIGAALAIAVAKGEGLAEPSYFVRRDGRVQVSADGSRGARARWVAACLDLGLTVAPAPWEQRSKEAS